jgi:hypothetical protein
LCKHFLAFFLNFLDGTVKLVAIESTAGYLPGFHRGDLIGGIGPVVRRLLLALGVLSAFLISAPLHAALVITSVTRSLDVAATGGPSDHDELTTGGTYLFGLSTTGTSSAGVITADAVQVSDTPANVGSTMSGRGTLGSTADLTGATGFSALADSLFDATFTVDSAGPYALSADVEWTGTSAPYEGFAGITLEDGAGNDLAVVMRTFALQGAASIDTVVTLNPGTTYHLVARGRIEGGGDPGEGVYGADASWEFELVAVPEASAVLVLSPLALIAGWNAWRSRRKALA